MEFELVRNSEMEEIMNNATKQIGEYIASVERERILDALIGSTILDLQLEEIPDLEGFYELTLQTNAPSIPTLRPNIEEGKLTLTENKNVVYSPQTIKFKVKW